ncbi:MAG: mannose-1-phosphate guanylyltransferase [Candidatus Binatia bacterium]
MKTARRNSHRFAVIIAGGRGSRFWPLSRPQRPKQLLRIFSRKSLIKETTDRIVPLFGRENTLVITVANHYSSVRKELHTLPKANILVEPQGNNTAPCIGFAATELDARDPDAVMTVLPADHWISDVKSFGRTIKAAIQVVQAHEALLTIGIRPGYPETGYGYILKGNKLKGSKGLRLYEVKSFKEKPTLKKAGQLIQLGSLWNSGIFVWRASTLLSSLQRFIPSLSGCLQRIREQTQGSGLGTPRPKIRALIQKEYKRMPNISIDHAVLEKAGSEGKVLTLEANFGWSDIGNWAAVHRMLPRDRNGNAGVGKWVAFKSSDCLVYSPKRLVTLLGLEKTVVVDTSDALLVADITRAQEVKDLVDELQQKGYRRQTDK